ncbi:MAG: hypothetical protein IJ711_11565 [Lachnospiraceae bacterium]|nr:hypothetical protein [Lachnospiraceae bacterium]
MSKSFEEEYRQLMTDEAPDLWDRIEANLPEKTAVPAEIPSIERSRDKAVRNRSLQKTAIAAGISLLVLAGGAAAFGIGSGRGKNNSMMDASDVAMVPDEAWDDAAYVAESDEGADAMESDDVAYEMAEDVLADEAASDTVTGAEENADAAQESSSEMKAQDSVAANRNETSKGAAQSSGNLSDSEKAMTDAATADAAKGAEDAADDTPAQTNGASVLTAEGVLYHLTLRITGRENTGEEIIYYGEVILAQEQAVSEGSTVSFCISDDAFAEPEDGQIYAVTLEDSTPGLSEEHPYILREISQ